MTLRLGTRGSALALAQSGSFAAALTAATGEPVELVEIVTDGDRSSAPVPQLGVGVFVSALRDALHAKEVDFAVHSYKDLPTLPADGLTVAAIPTRDDPRDALISRDGGTLADLGSGARIGTAPVAQLLALGRGFGPRRAAASTPAAQGHRGHLDAVVLAAAGRRCLGRP
jgi:hydroxymethylbilane synthase